MDEGENTSDKGLVNLARDFSGGFANGSDKMIPCKIEKNSLLRGY